MPIKIFFCYAHEDEAHLNTLKKHLRPLQRQGLIDMWYDRDISAGTEWEQEITEQLNNADIILLLISPDFMDSDYCYGIEMKRAIERHEQHTTRVIPVILRPIYWQGVLGKLQALPKNAIPIVNQIWHSQDDAFHDVEESIRAVVEELGKKQKPSPPKDTPLLQRTKEQWVDEGNALFDKQHNQTEHDILLGNPQEAALQAYLDNISELLLEKKLRESVAGDEIRKLARVRTLTVLPQLDKGRKGSVLRFLYEFGLILKSKTIIYLDSADLSSTKLSDANLNGADLSGADLIGADLSGTKLIGAKLIGADLSLVNLSRADLTYADLSGTKLSAADLTYANLTYANPIDADLSYADLSYADLSSANLTYANLTYANLNLVNLSRAKLIYAEVTQEQLDKANSLQGTTMPNGLIHT